MSGLPGTAAALLLGAAAATIGTPTGVSGGLASVLHESAGAWPATEVAVHQPDVIVDVAAREVYVDSERVHLTRRESASCST